MEPLPQLSLMVIRSRVSSVDGTGTTWQLVLYPVGLVGVGQPDHHYAKSHINPFYTSQAEAGMSEPCKEDLVKWWRP